MIRKKSLTIALLTFTSSCANTIKVAPQVDEERVTVYLVDHGRTSSVAISDCPEKGQITRFAYGDWRYYALIQRSIWRGAAALLWPTTATLGRQQLTDPSNLPRLAVEVAAPASDILVLSTKRTDAEKLCTQLEAQWRNGGERVYNDESRMDFVKLRAPRYHLFHNSNHTSKLWLRQLGHDVAGYSVLSIWRVEPRGHSKL